MNETARPRYRFGELVLSPGQRLLLRGGERHRVVEREEIHQLVWGGVAVTDGAFTQAVRTVRRALGDDDPREPRFIRTAARHGYQFVFAPVTEEDDAVPLDSAGGAARGEASIAGRDADGTVASAGNAAANAATSQAGLTSRGVADALAPVGPAVSSKPLAAAIAGLGGGALGAGGAGLVAALLLSSLLILAGGGHWPLVPVLTVLGAAVGAWGGGLVGAGIAVGAGRPRSHGLATVASGALGGGIAGAVGHQLVGWTMSELLGRPVSALGGAFEGVVLGGAVALGLVLAAGVDRRSGASLAGVLAAALCGAVAAGLLAAAGARLAGISLDAIADALKGARILAPLGTYLGEPPPVGQRGAGPATRLAVSLLEGGFFGGGVAWGLGRVRAPLPRRAPAA